VSAGNPPGALARVAQRHYRRFATFLGVGAFGVVVANGGLALLRELAHLSVYLSATLAWQAAILVTFTLNSLITWRGHKHRSLGGQFVFFEAVSLVGLLIYLVTIAVVHSGIGLHYLIGGLAGSGVAAIWNYAANHRLTFARQAGARLMRFRAPL
jgi:putative flippase GtrA